MKVKTVVGDEHRVQVEGTKVWCERTVGEGNIEDW